MTLKEIYQALIDGKKLKYASKGYKDFVHIVGNNIADSSGDLRSPDFTDKGHWSIYEEPKPKVMRAQYAFMTEKGGHIMRSAVYYIDDDDFTERFSATRPYWFMRLGEIECPE